MKKSILKRLQKRKQITSEKDIINVPTLSADRSILAKQLNWMFWHGIYPYGRNKFSDYEKEIQEFNKVQS